MLNLRLLIVSCRLVLLFVLHTLPIILKFSKHLDHCDYEVAFDILVQPFNNEVVVVQKQLHFVMPVLLYQLFLKPCQLLDKGDQHQPKIFGNGRTHELSHIQFVVKPAVFQNADEVELIFQN